MSPTLVHYQHMGEERVSSFTINNKYRWLEMQLAFILADITILENSTCNRFVLLVSQITESRPGARQHRFFSYDYQACNFSLLIKQFRYGFLISTQ